LTVFLAVIMLLAEKWVPVPLNMGLYIIMIIALAAITTIVHVVLIKVSEGKPQRFIRVFMIATMVKLLVYLILILSVAFNFRQQAAGLLIAFLIFYICFTTLEVIFLRRHLDSQGS